MLAPGPPATDPPGRRRAWPGSADAAGYEIADRAHAPAAPLSPAGRALHDRFVAALDDDLDLPGALACVREMLRADLPADERRWLVLDADAVLGLDLHRVWEAPAATAPTEVPSVPAEIAALVAARDAARAAHDYARADELRDEHRRTRAGTWSTARAARRSTRATAARAASVGVRPAGCVSPNAPGQGAAMSRRS